MTKEKPDNRANDERLERCIHAAVITLHGNFNYGNRLQCYAVVRTIREFGCAPCELILANAEPFQMRFERSAKNAVKRILGMVPAVRAEKLSSPARLEAFARFDKLIPSKTCGGPSRVLADEYDIVFVGSDQVWNPRYSKYRNSWYYASFARPEQRVALSASLGIDKFKSRSEARRVAKGVRDFSRISVREKRGAELVRECSGREAEVLCDPTLALAAEDWRAVADSRLTPESPYVFTYLLGGVSEDAAKALDAATQAGIVPVVSLTAHQQPGELDAGPAEFIDLVDHASHVVTDSFHASAFSMILGTPLTIVRRGGTGAGMFSRLEQLADTYGLWDKVFGSVEFDLSRAGDYVGAQNAIAVERGRYMDYLNAILAGEGQGFRE